MRKPLSMLSVLALSVGIAMSAAPAQAALPSLLGSNQEMPSLAPVLEQVTRAVVNISVSGKKITRQRLPEQFKFFFGPNMPDEQVSEQPFQALGSGVIVDAKKGYVITNAHVVHEADEIKVNLKDGREYAAKKIGEDKQSDIALLQIKAEDLVQIKFADSDELRVGDYARAIGNPFGLARPSPPVLSVRWVAAASTSRIWRTSSRPMRPSTPVTPAAPCSTCVAS